MLIKQTTYEKNQTIDCLYRCSYFSNNTNAQSWNHITHTIGSMNIGGTNVTVTQSGCLDVFTTYCPNITTPFIIGYNADNSSFCSGP